MNEAVRYGQEAIERKRDCDGAYYLLCRALLPPTLSGSI